VYAYDRENARILAFEKSNGDFVAQYRLAGDDDSWEGLVGMYAVAGLDGAPDTLVWASDTGVHRVVLGPAEDPDASPDPSADPDAEPSADEAPDS
jgi:hypothetical protein